MAEAILCKHCQSDLRLKVPTPTAWPLPSDRKTCLVGKIVTGVIAAITLYLAVGFYAGNEPQDEASTQAREAVERCREEVNSYSGPAAGKSVIADACRTLEDELRKNLNHAS
ncbi:hypothetical protein [Pseudomonas sp. NPDC089569]|uniref:hypothetical protein n=1 Tax=Pseudomonas sp. NPDC089569 TaxID=3390722 RepID=UPI003CFBDED5